MRKTKTNQNKRTSVKSCDTSTLIKTRTNRTSAKTLPFRNSRPKTMILTVERTANGYTLQEVTLLNKINQYTARSVSVDPRSITEDLNKKGFIA